MMRIHLPVHLLIGSMIAVSLVFFAPGCEKMKAPKPQQQSQPLPQLKPLVNPPLKWVDFMTSEMNQWNRTARPEAFNACGSRKYTAEQLRSCVNEKVPEAMRMRTWSIPLYTAPSTTSAKAGEIRITGDILAGFTLQYIAPDGAAVSFKPDDETNTEETEFQYHTVLDQRDNWVLLPRAPFPAEVWMDSSQRMVLEAGDDVYELGGQSIVILEVQTTGVRARQEIPTDFSCGDPVESIPENKIKKFSIPWSELYDENHHLRLKRKHSIC